MPGSEQNKNQERLGLIVHPFRVFLIEAFLFIIILSLGNVVAFKFSKILKVQKISLPGLSFWQFLLYFLFFTLFILFVSFSRKFKKGKSFVFKSLFIFSVFSGGLFSLNIWLGDFFSLILILILIIWWIKKPTVLNHNILIVLGISGVGGILGLELKPLTVVFLLIIFSIYDFIAVYRTKHMVKMAKEMISSGAILGIIVPQNILDFKEELREVRPGGRFLILGGGDIAFPLLFSASLISQGILNSLIVAGFSLIGLFSGFYFFIRQKKCKPIPALPLIAIFSIVGYIITKLL